MQNILPVERMEEAEKEMDPKVFSYLRQDQTETFEGFADFYLLAFDWYEIKGAETQTEKILIYLDQDDLFFFCQDERSLHLVQRLMPSGQNNEGALYQFFVNLLRDDMNYLDTCEEEITEAENAALACGGKSDYLAKIVRYRKELLRLKRYYEQLTEIFDDLQVDNEKLLTKEARRRFAILENRTERFYHTVLNLRDYVTQMREAYQAQIDIQQNELMKLFTVLTAVFLPLTLVVGWYGMNFQNMPELSWKYGYPAVIVLSIAICAVLIIWFKKKKWF